MYVKIKQLYLQNKVITYYVVLGLCTETMKNRLEGEVICDKINKESDVIKLLKLIKRILYAHESKSYPFLAVNQAMKSFDASHQQKTTLCDFYWDSMMNM